MFESGARPGDPLVICDQCGFRFPMSQTKKQWDGLRVCYKDFDPKHPQLSIRGLPDRQAVYDGRPEPPPVFIFSYGLGTFCLRSPNGTLYIVTVDDDGAVLVRPGFFGTPLDFITICGFDITVADDGALLTNVGATPGAPTWRMVSPTNYVYSVTVAADGAWQVEQVNSW